MKTNVLRITYLAAALLASGAFAATGPTCPRTEQGHHSGLAAKITLPDGATRTVKLEGVGCSLAICSRTAIKGRAGGNSLERTWLDTVASIRQTSPDDALLVLKNGAEKRISLDKDFRVLYLASPGGGTEKLDLSGVKSIEFPGPERR